METPDQPTKQLGPGSSRAESKIQPVPPIRGAQQQQRPGRPGDQRGEAPASGLFEYYRIIQRRRGAVIVISCLGMLAGFLYTLPQTPIYQAQSVIEIQEMNEDFLHMRDVSPTSSGAGGGEVGDAELATQVRVLQSRTLMERVVKKLGLEKTALDPHPTRLDAWRKALKLAPAQAPTREQIIQNAAGGLRVRAQVNTRLIEINCDSTNPRMAADFANAVASEYIDMNREAHWNSTQDTGKWLAEQMDDIKGDLEKHEDQLQQYAQSAGLLFSGEKENMADDRLKALQDSLVKAREDRITKQSPWELAKQLPPESLGAIIDDTALREIEGKLIDLRRQLAQVSLTYTDNSKEVRQIKDQIAPLETGVQEARQNTLNRLKNDYQAALQREQLFQTDYDDAVTTVTKQADDVNHYNILKREVDSDKGIYDNMLQRVKEAGIASALRASNIQKVDSAMVPGAPYKPNVFNNSILGAFLGFFGGIGIVVLLDRADRTIQEPADISTFLGVPEIGLVPSASTDWLKPRSGNPFSGKGPKEDQMAPEAVAMVATGRKNSAMAESFHDAITSILYSGGGIDPPRVLVFSSPGPKEGKTTITTNIAIAFAQIRRRVLLIDCDLRRPRLHHVFGLDNTEGIVDLLRRSEPVETPLNGLIRETVVPNLSVMTAGRADAGDPTLLHSIRLGEIVDACRNQFDMVLIDTPPMLTMADARVIARHADAVVLVARANQTSRYSLRDVCQRLDKDGTRVLGAVLNDWNPKKSGRYTYYRYYDKYRHYYKAPETDSR